MTHHSAVRGTRRGVAVLAVLVASGCGKGDQGKARASAAANPAAGAARASMPGALSKALEQYTGDELFALTRRVQFGGGVDVGRRCRGQAACRGARPTATTQIRLDAVVGEDSLSAATLPANGAIAARAINHGQFADTMYNMRPGPYENYLIVLPVAGGATARWRLEELSITAGARVHRTIATGIFRECGHQFLAGPRADFKTCAQAATTRQASLGTMLQDGIEPPIWIGCLAGCCTADQPDGHT